MFVLTVVAIGVDPRRPVIAENWLEAAAWVGAGAHNLLRMSLRNYWAGHPTLRDGAGHPTLN